MNSSDDKSSFLPKTRFLLSCILHAFLNDVNASSFIPCVSLSYLSDEYSSYAFSVDMLISLLFLLYLNEPLYNTFFK